MKLDLYETVDFDPNGHAPDCRLANWPDSKVPVLEVN